MSREMSSYWRHALPTSPGGEVVARSAAGGVTAPKAAPSSGVAAHPDFAAAPSRLRLLMENKRRA